jgi:hypothetical protein
MPPSLLTADAAFPPNRADSLFRLDLSFFPEIISNGELRKCSLVIGGDFRFSERTQVEFYRSEGKHPITMLRPVSEVHKVYELTTADRAILEQMAAIPAFDPYTLRSALKTTFRRLVEKGVLCEPLNFDETVFRLSRETQYHLAKYTCHFTDPLMEALFDGLAEPEAMRNLTLMQRLRRAEKNSDPQTRATIVRNCRLMQERFHAKSLTEVSDILDEFGEKFLAVAYYKRYYFHAISKPLHLFMKEMALMHRHLATVKVPRFDVVYHQVLIALKETLMQVETILNGFETNLTDIWHNVDLPMFHELVSLIEECHKHMGTILVAWAIRLDAWTYAKETGELKSIDAKAEFLLRTVFHGLEHVPTDIKGIAKTLETLRSVSNLFLRKA